MCTLVMLGVTVKNVTYSREKQSRGPWGLRWLTSQSEPASPSAQRKADQAELWGHLPGGRLMGTRLVSHRQGTAQLGAGTRLQRLLPGGVQLGETGSILHNPHSLVLANAPRLTHRPKSETAQVQQQHFPLLRLPGGTS